MDFIVIINVEGDNTVVTIIEIHVARISLRKINSSFIDLIEYLIIEVYLTCFEGITYGVCTNDEASFANSEDTATMVLLVGGTSSASFGGGASLASILGWASLASIVGGASLAPNVGGASLAPI